MQDQGDLSSRCASIVAALDTQLGWLLSADERGYYRTALTQILSENCSDNHMRNVAIYYHLDHARVEALADCLHVQHDAAWQSWMGQVVPILHRAGLSWSNDSAVDDEDLAQIARAELARAIPTFRYASRFSTWAHQVIVRSVQRYLRDRQASKRAGRPASLDALSEGELPMSAAGRPEPAVDARILAALVDDILRAQPDQRLAVIFRLWVGEDARVEEIGRRIQLSPSQVRALLGRIRQILQSEPAIRAWREGEEPPQEL